MVGLLAGWLAGWLVGWFAGWFVGLLVGVVKVLDCPTQDMHADPFTKNLSTISFQLHRDVMLGTAPCTSPAIPPVTGSNEPRHRERGGVSG